MFLAASVQVFFAPLVFSSRGLACFACAFLLVCCAEGTEIKWFVGHGRYYWRLSRSRGDAEWSATHREGAFVVLGVEIGGGVMECDIELYSAFMLW